MLIKGVVHSSKTFADNLLTPMSSKMSKSFFLQLKRKSDEIFEVFDENIAGFSPYNGLVPNGSRSK